MSKDIITYSKQHSLYKKLPSYEDLKSDSYSQESSVKNAPIKLDFEPDVSFSKDNMSKKIIAELFQFKKNLEVNGIYEMNGSTTVPLRIDFNIFGSQNRFYVKKFDPLRIIGLELYNMLSHFKQGFLVNPKAIYEQNVEGLIFGDLSEEDKDFFLNDTHFMEKMIRLDEFSQRLFLGDLHDYNIMIVPFDDESGKRYFVKAFDFDRQFKDNDFGVKIAKFNSKALNAFPANEIENIRDLEFGSIVEKVEKNKKKFESLLSIVDELIPQADVNELGKFAALRFNNLAFYDLDKVSDIVKLSLGLF